MALWVCSENHEEICYEGHNCPACETINDLKEQIADLEKEKIALEQEVDRLES